MFQRDVSVTFFVASLLGVSLLACKKSSDEPARAQQEPAAVPAASVAPSGDVAPAATPSPAPVEPAPPSAAAAGGPAAELSFDIAAVPSIPSTRSNPPQGNEWNQGVAVNTQGASTRAKRCSLHVLREWLRINCSGKVLGYEKKEDFGEQHRDYYEEIVAGKYASFVVRLQKGKNQKIRVCRAEDRASLFVSWPPTADKPLHIALSQGPACDGSDWGVGYGKAGGSALRVTPGAGGGGPLNDDVTQRAAVLCQAGSRDACWVYCGATTCR